MTHLRHHLSGTPATLNSPGQCLGDLMRAVNEKLCDRAERSSFQCDDADWPARRWQIDRQDLECRMVEVEFHHGTLNDADKAAGGKQRIARGRD